MSASACVTVSVACEAWLTACPDAAALAETAARAALAGAQGSRATAPVVADVVVADVVLTDDAEQRRLNRTYRGIDAPTNVLAFALADPAAAPVGMPLLLGDVVLAFETVEREAGGPDKRLADHLCHLVVHGVLHLLGFDHQNEAEAAVMEARETAILTGLGMADPYRDTM
ncbi:MAG TPA: rRNA maturation RNase YbeY [Stellaceae bacterium]|nr:rRNA maturation RNase YbeY [Stellaceae bacterium]